jgi:hypothetical protein
LNSDVTAGWTATKFRRWRFSGVADGAGAFTADSGSDVGGVPHGQLWSWDRWGGYASAVGGTPTYRLWLGAIGDRRLLDASVSAGGVPLSSGPVILMEGEWATWEFLGLTAAAAVSIHVLGRQLEPCADCTCSSAPDAVVELVRGALIGGGPSRAPAPDLERPYDGYSLGPDERGITANPNWSPKRYRLEQPDQTEVVVQDAPEGW